MKRIIALTILMLVSMTALAQSNGGGITYPYIVNPATVAPSGSCAGPQIQVLGSNGAIYTCNNGTWAAFSSGSGTFTALTGDATSTATGGATTVVGINGTALSGLATGILKNTTATGVPSIATAGTDYAGPSTANTFSANQIISAAGAASTSPLLLSGAWETGGAATTNYPQLYIKANGASDGALNTNGSGLVINAATGCALANYIAGQVNGGTVNFAVTCAGQLTANSTITSSAGSISATNGTVTGKLFATASNCTSAASPAVCASAAAGTVVVAAAATTVQVNTTAVTANSIILVQEDSSLGTKLTVTCNTTPATAPPTISARTAATSFTITTTTPAVNPRCFSYSIID
jgi:hypothetical protein